MKLTDIDRVNHLVAELADIKALIETAEHSDAASYQVFIEVPGDAGLRMSAEGASTRHSRGIDVSSAFLTKVKHLAVSEPQSRQKGSLADLSALGVDTAP